MTRKHDGRFERIHEEPASVTCRAVRDYGIRRYPFSHRVRGAQRMGGAMSAAEVMIPPRSRAHRDVWVFVEAWCGDCGMHTTADRMTDDGLCRQCAIVDGTL